MTAELSLKLIAEPVTHFAVKRRGKRWVNPFYNLYQFNIKLLKVARCPSWDNSNQLQVTTGPENSLDAACIQLCGEFPTLFESTLGCLKYFYFQEAWELTDFNSYGTPVVPIRKSPLPGQAKASIRVCGDYSVTVNSQLEDHRQPIPLPEDLLRKLGRVYCFSKIDLANAYDQICLSPDSQYFRKDFLSELNPHQGISKKSWNS